MSEEPQNKNALMDALYDAAEEDTTPVENNSPQAPRSLGDILRQQEAGTLEAPAQAEQPAEPAEQPEEEAPKVGEREVKLVKEQPVVQQVVQQVVQPAEPAPLQPPANPEEGLMPEQIERLRLARVAEQAYRDDPHNSPAEYQGLYKKYLDFYTKESEYVQNQLQSGESLEWDEDYKKLKEELDPNLSDTMIRKLEREDIKREITSDLNSQRQEIAQLKSQIHQQTTAPKVEETLKSYHKENYEASVPKEIREKLKENRDGFKESNPFEYEAIDRTLKHTHTLIGQFERVNNGLERYDPQKHQRLAGRIEALGQAHKKNAKSKGGKKFVTRAEFAKLPQDQRAGVYTWSADDVKKAFMGASKATIENKLQEINEKVSKYKNGSSPSRPRPQQVEPTPKTATPRTPPPSSSESTPEEGKSALVSMLLD